MDSGDEKANGDEGTDDDAWTGEGGGAVRADEEGEAVMLGSQTDTSSADLYSLDES